MFTDISGVCGVDNTDRRVYPVLYRALVLARDYGVLDKILFGSDYPIALPAHCMSLLRNINRYTKNTELPQIPEDAIYNIIEENYKRVFKF